MGYHLNIQILCGSQLITFNPGARWGGWSTPRHGHFTPDKDSVPIVGEVGPMAGRDEYGKSRPLLAFDPWTVQPVANHCTNYCIPGNSN